jgi:hypothetical protein
MGWRSMILILAPHEDLHARRVAQEVERLGDTALILDAREAGSGLRASMRFVGSDREILVRRARGTPIENLDAVDAVWTRRPGRPTVPGSVLDADHRQFALSEWRSLLDGMTATIGMSTRVVNPLEAQRAAAVKPYQLAVAQRVGLRIPDTLITSDPQHVKEFIDRHQGSVIHKAMTALPQAFLETRLWQDEDLSRLEHLPLAPTIFQEFIDGPADIRVTIAGDEQFAAQIASSSSRIGIDSRLDLDVPARACDLPSDVSASLDALMRGLGLSFATIDLKLDAQGDHYFLEVNPQGQFLYIEILTGQLISAAVARTLVNG